MQIYMKFLNYTQTKKIFVRTHRVRPKKYRGRITNLQKLFYDKEKYFIVKKKSLSLHRFF